MTLLQSQEKKTKQCSITIPLPKSRTTNHKRKPKKSSCFCSNHLQHLIHFTWSLIHFNIILRKSRHIDPTKKVMHWTMYNQFYIQILSPFLISKHGGPLPTKVPSPRNYISFLDMLLRFAILISLISLSYKFSPKNSSTKLSQETEPFS